MPPPTHNSDYNTNNDHTLDESAPLLRHQHQQHQHDESTKPNKPRSFLPIPLSRIPIPILVPVIGILSVFLNESEFYIKQAALLRAIEAMACHEYYAAQHSPLADLGKRIPELHCKTTGIQERVAALYGTLYVVRLSCAVAGAFLVVSLFSTGRRRPVLVIHKVNIVVASVLLLIAWFGYPRLPIWFICFHGVTAFFGGNYDLGVSVLLAAYADVIPDPTRRNSLIFITASMQYLSQAVCLPLTSKLMNLSGDGTTPEVSFYVSTACGVVVFLLMLFLFPETNQQTAANDSNKPTNGDGDQEQSAPQSDTDTPHTTDSPQPDETTSSKKPYYVLRNEFGLTQVSLLLLAMFCSTTSSRLIDWYGTLQFPGIKYKWMLSKTAYLICMQAILSFINFALVLPAINKICQQKLKISSRSTSIGIVVASCLIIGICAVVMGLPGTSPVVFVVVTAVYTLGSGVNSAIQTYTVSAAGSVRASGAALTFISLAATMGKVAASAIWPATLSVGLEDPSGKLEGLPFFVVAGLVVVLIVVMCLAAGTGRNKKKE